MECLPGHVLHRPAAALPYARGCDAGSVPAGLVRRTASARPEWVGTPGSALTAVAPTGPSAADAASAVASAGRPAVDAAVADAGTVRTGRAHACTAASRAAKAPDRGHGGLVAARRGGPARRR